MKKNAKKGTVVLRGKQRVAKSKKRVAAKVFHVILAVKVAFAPLPLMPPAVLETSPILLTEYISGANKNPKYKPFPTRTRRKFR